jgi:hypothetical protein
LCAPHIDERLSVRTYSVRGIGIATSIAVAITILLDAVISVWPAAGRVFAVRARTDDDPNLLNAATAVEALLSLIWLVIYLITGILVIVWFYRARRNLAAFPDVAPRMRVGWAITGWLVPFVNLVVPCRVMADIARGSLSRTRTPALVGVWWAAWLVYNVVGLAVAGADVEASDALPTALAGPDDYQQYVDYYEGALVPNLLALLPGIVAAIALIVLVRRISAAQGRRIAAGGPAAPVMPGMSVQSPVAQDPWGGTIGA